MASSSSSSSSFSYSFLLLLLLLLALHLFSSSSSSSLFTACDAAAMDWLPATATAYGDSFGTTNAGACGFGTLYNNGYGQNTAAISGALFQEGKGCGSCFEVMCDHESSYGHLCLNPRGKTVVVTATNYCPASRIGWCNAPNKHFDIAQVAFSQISEYSAQPVPVLYKSVACTREGGMQFTINGNSQYNIVLLTNVGGTGSVRGVYVKGSKTPDWMPLLRMWGSNWRTTEDLRGQSLSFRVVMSDGSAVVSKDVAPATWKLGETFHGLQAP